MKRFLQFALPVLAITGIVATAMLGGSSSSSSTTPKKSASKKPDKLSQADRNLVKKAIAPPATTKGRATATANSQGVNINTGGAQVPVMTPSGYKLSSSSFDLYCDKRSGGAWGIAFPSPYGVFCYGRIFAGTVGTSGKPMRKLWVGKYNFATKKFYADCKKVSGKELCKQFYTSTTDYYSVYKTLWLSS